MLDLQVGVTLASDQGKNRSPGALICSETIETKHMIRVRGSMYESRESVYWIPTLDRALSTIIGPSKWDASINITIDSQPT